MSFVLDWVYRICDVFPKKNKADEGMMWRDYAALAQKIFSKPLIVFRQR